MPTNRPLILITNDDSVFAPGLHLLIDYVKSMGDVVAMLPMHPIQGSRQLFRSTRCFR